KLEAVQREHEAEEKRHVAQHLVDVLEEQGIKPEEDDDGDRKPFGNVEATQPVDQQQRGNGERVHEDQRRDHSLAKRDLKSGKQYGKTRVERVLLVVVALGLVNLGPVLVSVVSDEVTSDAAKRGAVAASPPLSVKRGQPGDC